MSDSKKSIASEIEGMKTIGNFVIAHEEIAANNMRRIRDAVVRKRDFIKEITELYNEVKHSYQKEVIKILSHGKKHKNFKIFKTYNKTACVLLSTNSSLYGDIIKNTYDLFKNSINKIDQEVVIVGKVGKRIFEDDNPGVKFAYFDFPDSAMDISLLKPIILHIIQYEKVIIFHSKFQTLLRQTPASFVITESEYDKDRPVSQRRYLFEPSLSKVIEYFEKEIFSSIFQQTMHESHLSKYASRMVTLDAASENVKKKLKDLSLKEKIMRHQLLNKDQVNSMVRIIKWRTT